MLLLQTFAWILGIYIVASWVFWVITAIRYRWDDWKNGQLSLVMIGADLIIAVMAPVWIPVAMILTYQNRPRKRP